MTSQAPRLLLDEHLHLGVARGLRRLGMDVVHVSEVGLAGKSDPVVFDESVKERRIVVTRDYRGFLPLVSHRSAQVPGLLLVPSSIPEGDPGALLRAVRAWAEQKAETDAPSASAVEWLAPHHRRGAADRHVRERPPSYVHALRHVRAEPTARR